MECEALRIDNQINAERAQHVKENRLKISQLLKESFSVDARVLHLGVIEMIALTFRMIQMVTMAIF